jgi:hypothetical protein
VRNRWRLDAMLRRRAALCGALDAQVFPRRQFSALPEWVEQTA